jgi:hypothetical protein
MNDFNVRLHMKYKSARVVPPPGAATPAVPQLFADRSIALLHKTRSLLIPRRQKLPGRVANSTFLRADLDTIAFSVYLESSTLLNIGRLRDDHGPEN